MYLESFDQAKQREKAFTYHPPQPGQPARYEAIRGAAKQLSQLLNQSCPPSRELSLAQTKLEEAAFYANAAIARNEASSLPSPE